MMIPPAIILIIAGILMPVLSPRLRQMLMVLAPIATLYAIYHVPANAELWTIAWGGLELQPIVMQPYTLIFSTVFAIAALGGGIYGLKLHKPLEMAAAFIYAGSAIGVTFSGDWVSLFIYWEMMAVGSTLVLLFGGRKNTLPAAFRYVMAHFLGGIILLLGILLYALASGDMSVGPLALNTNDVLKMFMGELPDLATFAQMLILVGVLVNIAAPPFSSWLPDSYPEASPLGAVFLSAFTTKTAVFVLLTLFSGLSLLIPIGLFMVFYGIVYAMLENDMRRILSYSIVNQVGFMVTGVGIGTTLAQYGVASHAFCHIIYKALLLMSAGSVIVQTGKHKCSEVGGLFRTMPITMWCGIIGAMAISAFPFTSGFVSKSLISSAAAAQHLELVWLLLMAASAGVFLHAGIKFPWFVFFHRDSGLRPKDPAMSMRIAMLIFSALCIIPALYPPLLYQMLPGAVDYEPYTAAHLVTQLQLLLFAGLVFFLFVQFSKILERTDTVSLDIDYVYRKPLFHMMVVKTDILFQAYHFVTSQLVRTIKGIKNFIYQYHGPTAVLARNWGVGSTVLYSTGILALLLIIYYLAG